MIQLWMLFLGSPLLYILIQMMIKLYKLVLQRHFQKCKSLLISKSKRQIRALLVKILEQYFPEKDLPTTEKHYFPTFIQSQPTLETSNKQPDNNLPEKYSKLQNIQTEPIQSLISAKYLQKQESLRPSSPNESFGHEVSKEIQKKIQTKNLNENEILQQLQEAKYLSLQQNKPPQSELLNQSKLALTEETGQQNMHEISTLPLSAKDSQIKENYQTSTIRIQSNSEILLESKLIFSQFQNSHASCLDGSDSDSNEEYRPPQFSVFPRVQYHNSDPFLEDAHYITIPLQRNSNIVIQLQPMI